MKSIKRLLVPDIKKQQQTKGNRERQTHNINNAEGAVLYNVAPGDFEIVFYHFYY